MFSRRTLFIVLINGREEFLGVWVKIDTADCASI